MNCHNNNYNNIMKYQSYTVNHVLSNDEIEPRLTISVFLDKEEEDKIENNPELKTAAYLNTNSEDILKYEMPKLKWLLIMNLLKDYKVSDLKKTCPNLESIIIDNNNYIVDIRDISNDIEYFIDPDSHHNHLMREDQLKNIYWEDDYVNKYKHPYYTDKNWKLDNSAEKYVYIAIRSEPYHGFSCPNVFETYSLAESFIKEYINEQPSRYEWKKDEEYPNQWCDKYGESYHIMKKKMNS
jgi:hypothetical protein